MDKREPDFVDECYADKDLSQLQKLTLVIPTYNRNYYLSRCLWYHAHFPFGEIIVADSSPEEKKVVNRETVAKIRSIFSANIRYLEYEPETDKYGGDIYRKWGNAVQYVETEYSQICTDKEFVFPLSSNVGITFLENNPDYGSYDGYYVDVNVKRNILSPQKRFTERKSISESDAYLRLLLGISHSFSSINLFAVKRTWIQKAIFSPIVSGIINDIRFGEAGVELLTLISAKYYYDDELPQKYRDVTHSTKHRRRILAESSDSRYPYLNQYIRDGTYECHFKPFVDCIKQNVEMDSTKNVDVDTIQWVLTPYLERRQLLLSTYNQLLRKFNWVLRIIPTIFRRKLQSLIAQATKTREFNAGRYEKLILELIRKETMRDSVKRWNIDLPFIW